MTLKGQNCKKTLGHCLKPSTWVYIGFLVADDNSECGVKGLF